jgi:multidrug resistance efflux pump
MERLGVRPVTLAVFLACLIGAVWLEVATRADVTVAAVGWAPPFEHPAVVETFVAETHVQPGDLVGPGAKLLTLSDESLRRQLAVVDAEIRRTILEGRFEQTRAAADREDRQLDRHLELSRALRDARVARAMAKRSGTVAAQAGEMAERTRQLMEQRMIAADIGWQIEAEATVENASAEEAGDLVRAELTRLRELRSRLQESGADSTLEQSIAQYYEAQLEVWRSQREGLQADMERLTVRAGSGGIVSRVLPRGTPVALGISVAEVVPERAREVIAYLPPETNPTLVSNGGRVLIAQAGGNACAGQLPQRRGGRVGAAPDQLMSPFGQVVYGLPVHIALPEECPLGVGQLVEVTFEAP